MRQLDFVGEVPPPAPFKDIRGTRSSVAEEKAVLAMTLGRLLSKVPSLVRNGSIQATRQWRDSHAIARKTLGDKRASVGELTDAIAHMREWWPEGDPK